MMKIRDFLLVSPSIGTIAVSMLLTVTFWLSLPLWASRLFEDDRLERIEAKIDSLQRIRR